MEMKAPVLKELEGDLDLLVIAGEHSGDEHAARLVRDLAVLAPEVRVAALGGEALREAGADVVFDLVEHSVIGFAEVLKNYRFFRKLFFELIAWIERHRPRHVLLVDYPGFNLRLAAALQEKGLSRKGGGGIGVWQYIAPQVWAWKAKRRFKMAQVLDGLGCILPFEVEFFSDTRLPVAFVGHPFLHPAYELPLAYAPEAPVLLLPGSRVQQVNRVFPLQLEAYGRFLEQAAGPDAIAVVPSAKIRAELEKIAAGYPTVSGCLEYRTNREPVAGSAVLMSSGTMSLACALAGIPGTIVQRVQPVTYLLARLLVRIEYVGLANIILGRELIREYIQHADPVVLARELREAMENPERRREAEAGSRELQALLAGDGSRAAGEWLCECLNA